MLGRRVVVLPVAIALASALVGCLDPRNHDLGDWNAPTVAASSDGLAFTVSGYDFTFDRTYPGPTRGDSVPIGIQVSGYAGGSATVELIDSSGATQLHLPVTGNVAEGQGLSTVHGMAPYTVHLQFSHFSGVFVLGVGAALVVNDAAVGRSGVTGPS